MAKTKRAQVAIGYDATLTSVSKAAAFGVSAERAKFLQDLAREHIKKVKDHNPLLLIPILSAQCKTEEELVMVAANAGLNRARQLAGIEASHAKRKTQEQGAARATASASAHTQQMGRVHRGPAGLPMRSSISPLSIFMGGNLLGRAEVITLPQYTRLAPGIGKTVCGAASTYLAHEIISDELHRAFNPAYGRMFDMFMLNHPAPAHSFLDMSAGEPYNLYPWQLGLLDETYGSTHKISWSKMTQILSVEPYSEGIGVGFTVTSREGYKVIDNGDVIGFLPTCGVKSSDTKRAGRGWENDTEVLCSHSEYSATYEMAKQDFPAALYTRTVSPSDTGLKIVLSPKALLTEAEKATPAQVLQLAETKYPKEKYRKSWEWTDARMTSTVCRVSEKMDTRMHWAFKSPTSIFGW